MAHEFQNTPDRFGEVSRKMTRSSIPVMFIACGGALSFFVLQQGGNTPLLTYVFTIPLMLGALFIGNRIAIKKQKEIYHSYRLTINDQFIKRTQNNTPDIMMARNEVSQIMQLPDRGFVVKGNSLMNQVIIPAQIEQRETVEELLQAIKPVVTTKPFPLSIPVALGVLALFGGVVVSTNKAVVGICGSLLVITVGYSLVSLWLNKNVAKKIKLISLIALVMLASVIATVWFKLMA